MDEEDVRVEEVELADEGAADAPEAEGVADPRPGRLIPTLNGLELVGLAAAGSEPLGETTELLFVAVAAPSLLPAPEFVGALGSAPAPRTGTSGPAMALIKPEPARFLTMREWLTILLAATEDGRTIVQKVTRSARV